MSTEIKQLKDVGFSDFLFSFGLYHEIKVSEKDFLLLPGSFKTDYYNPQIGENTTFIHEETIYEHPIVKYNNLYGGKRPANFELFFNNGGYCFYVMKCTRNENKIVFCIFYDKEKSTWQKIGQFPSLATFQEHNYLKDYKGIITEEDAKCLSKACGLFAHGIGAGSLVYLRRVFERIIIQTWDENKESLGMTDEEFSHKRMEEKIALLKDYLPRNITQNTSIYGLLSIGIHELEEETCKTIFPVLIKITLLILEEKRSQKKHKEMEDALSNELSRFASSIKKK